MYIVVLYNQIGSSSTKNISESDDDTMQSALQVKSVLEQLGHRVEMKGIGMGDISTLGSLRCDLVFNLVEWTGKEWKHGVAVLETLESAGIHFTGSGSWGYEVSSNKILMKKLFEKHHIPTAGWRVFGGGDERSGKLDFPVILKPAYEHCGIGITQESVVNRPDDLLEKADILVRRFDQPVIAETFIDGLEGFVTVIEQQGEPVALPPAIFGYEKKEHYVPIMTYDAKWKSDSWEANMTQWQDDVLDKSVQDKMKQVAVECYRWLGGRSYPRIDMRIQNGQIYVLEINNNPGVGWDADGGLTHSCELAGMGYADFISGVIQNAL